uniref:Uncharacterized protein n=1 Tax=Eutreptiella gymnastica TaxID=73025 RepID=A0A7S4FUF9_9EUGL
MVAPNESRIKCGWVLRSTTSNVGGSYCMVPTSKNESATAEPEVADPHIDQPDPSAVDLLLATELRKFPSLQTLKDGDAAAGSDAAVSDVVHPSLKVLTWHHAVELG